MATNVPQEQLDAGRGYERLFVPAVFEPWTKHLIEAAGVGEGDCVLDVATGTGVLARQAFARTEPGGRVVGVDPAPGMLAVAGEAEPRIEWVLGAAENLDFPDGSFDCVVSQFGLMFFDDRLKALQEMRRVLRPGGALAVAVWNSVEANPAYAEVIAILEEQVGQAAADAVRLPFCLGDAAVTVHTARSAGFADVDVETRFQAATFPSPRVMVEAELRGWLPLFDIRLSESQIADVLDHSERALRRFTDVSGAAVFPTSAHVVTAANA